MSTQWRREIRYTHSFSGPAPISNWGPSSLGPPPSSPLDSPASLNWTRPLLPHWTRPPPAYDTQAPAVQCAFIAHYERPLAFSSPL